MSKLSSEQLFLTEAAKTLLDKEEHLPFLNLSRYQLWELAGVDGLQLVKRLASDVVEKISPLQSLDFIFTGYQYSVLRLGEGNFRLGLYGDLGTYGGLNFEEAIASVRIGLQVWAKPCGAMQTMAIPEATALDLLPQIAVVKPPHHLEDLPPNCAVSATIHEIPILIWRHRLLSEAVFELHTALQDAKTITRAAAQARSQ
ncbi:MAG: hypothetical protein F6K28_34295 [Microcoleus sp. SIO2G3]|nr:hypothetical protein [Microcoleus sp. SIO2G3]